MSITNFGFHCLLIEESFPWFPFFFPLTYWGWVYGRAYSLSWRMSRVVEKRVYSCCCWVECFLEVLSVPAGLYIVLFPHGPVFITCKVCTVITPFCSWGSLLRIGVGAKVWTWACQAQRPWEAIGTAFVSLCILEKSALSSFTLFQNNFLL